MAREGSGWGPGLEERVDGPLAGLQEAARHHSTQRNDVGEVKIALYKRNPQRRRLEFSRASHTVVQTFQRRTKHMATTWRAW